MEKDIKKCMEELSAWMHRWDVKVDGAYLSSAAAMGGFFNPDYCFSFRVDGHRIDVTSPIGIKASKNEYKEIIFKVPD